MIALDIVIILILVTGAIVGLVKGFFAQLVPIAAIVLGAWLAFTCSSAFSEWLASYLHTEGFWLNIITFLLIFIGIGILCRLLGKLVEEFFKFAMLGWLNRLLGAILCVVKYALILGLIVIVFNSINSRFGWVKDEKLAESKMYAMMKAGAYTVFPYFEGLLKGDKVLDVQKAAQTSKDTII